MKTRNGFVSNSSSCSFVIGFNDLDCEILEEIEDCYDIFVEEELSDDSCITDVTKQWNRNHEYDEFKYLYRITVDWNDQDLCELINNSVENIKTGFEGEDFKIIEGWY